MNSKLLPTLATIVVAVVSAVATTGALAVEATQFAPEASVKSRAEVQAELRGAKADATVVQYGEATVFVDKASTQTRAFARSETVGSPVQVVRLGEATEFIDQPGVRTRDDVRAETLAALRASRVSR
jgi:hypothetical protein